MAFACHQAEITLPPFQRGFHLITQQIIDALPQINLIQCGTCHVFIPHAGASLCLNESADPDVPKDLETIFNRIVPENAPGILHLAEGPDDMPSHAKSGILGASVQIPIVGGRLALGTWQGVFLGEHRNEAKNRRVIVTAMGTAAA